MTIIPSTTARIGGLLLTGLLCSAALSAEPAGATDLVPRSDSPAMVKVQIPVDAATTTTITPAQATASPAADTARPAATSNPFGEKNESLPAAVLAAKPYSLEIFYGAVKTPFVAGPTLLPTAEFFTHAKKLTVLVAKDDQGKFEDTAASLTYAVKPAGPTDDGFWIFAVGSVRGDTAENLTINTRLVVNKDDWTVVAGSTQAAADGTKRYFYWTIRLNTKAGKASTLTPDG